MNPLEQRPTTSPAGQTEVMPASAGETVVAVVATYNPGDGLREAVAALLGQVRQVVLVDDGSGARADDVLDSLVSERVSVTRLGRNQGIAAALNTGAAIARDLRAQYLLTMDQDSQLEPGYVERAVRAVEHLQRDGKGVLAVGAGTVNGDCIDGRDPRQHVPILDTLQSGLLFPLDSVTRVGEFDERLFIDCVDTEYILRGASRGLETFRAKECALGHALGHSIEARLPFGRSLRFAHHSAWRRYYITRNRIQVIRTYGLRFPKWTALQAYDQMRYFALTLLFGPRPGRQLVAFGVAVRHGLTSRLGPIPADLMYRLNGECGTSGRPA